MNHVWHSSLRTKVWGALLSVALSGCWAVCETSSLRPPDAFEPNDTASTATLLETSRDATFNTEENDVFRFTATATETITITVQTLEAGAQPPSYALCVRGMKQMFDETLRCDPRAYPQGSPLSFTAPKDDTYTIDIAEPAANCRHICGCPVRGSSYRVLLTRSPKPSAKTPISASDHAKLQAVTARAAKGHP